MTLISTGISMVKIGDTEEPSLGNKPRPLVNMGKKTFPITKAVNPAQIVDT